MPRQPLRGELVLRSPRARPRDVWDPPRVRRASRQRRSVARSAHVGRSQSSASVDLGLRWLVAVLRQLHCTTGPFPPRRFEACRFTPTGLPDNAPSPQPTAPRQRPPLDRGCCCLTMPIWSRLGIEGLWAALLLVLKAASGRTDHQRKRKAKQKACPSALLRIRLLFLVMVSFNTPWSHVEPSREGPGTRPTRR